MKKLLGNIKEMLTFMLLPPQPRNCQQLLESAEQLVDEACSAVLMQHSYTPQQNVEIQELNRHWKACLRSLEPSLLEMERRLSLRRFTRGDW